MNALTFEIHIGNKLEEEIKTYRRLLNDFLSENRTITIGVDNKVTQLLGQISTGFKDINDQQAKSIETLRSITRLLQEQQKAVSGSTDASKQSVVTANKEAEAYQRLAAEKEKAANAGANASSGANQLGWLKDMPTDSAIKGYFESCLRQINEYSGQINAALKKMTEGVDIEAMTGKFRQAVGALEKTLAPLSQMLSSISSLGGGSANKAQSMEAATQQLSSSLKTVAGAQKAATSATGEDAEAKKAASAELRTYINNILKIESAINRLQRAYDGVDAIRQKLADKGKDTSAIDAWQKNVENVKNALRSFQSNQAVVGQKGLMLTDTENALQELIKQLPRLAESTKMSDDQLKQLRSTIEQLGNGTPMGFNFKNILGQVGDFAQVEKDLRTLEGAENKLQDLRNSVTGAIKKTMVEGKDGVSLEKLRALFQEIDALQKKLANAQTPSDGVKALTHDYETLTQRVREAVAAQETALRNREKVTGRLDPIEQYLSSAQRTYNEGVKLGVGQQELSNLDAAIQKMRALQDEILSLSKKDYLDDARMKGLLDKYIQLRNTILNATSAVGEQNGKQLSQNKHDEAAAKKEAAEQAQSWRQAVENLGKYELKLRDAEALLKQVEEVNKRLGKGIPTDGLRDYIALLQSILLQLREIANNNIQGTRGYGRTNPDSVVDPNRKGELYGEVVGAYEKYFSTHGERAQADASKAVTQALREEREAQKQAEKAKKDAAAAAQRLAQEEQRLAQAFNSVTKEAHGQSQVLGDLKSLIYQYFSVYGAQQFLTNMVQVTGELELQRKSLEVILGSGTAASEMYYQLRDLSQQSPYTFEDLLKAHRQLAAFGIEAKDIYGTMKSLTDIGAGLDVPVERLILAYGHTKSYGYLSGIQNRQFETAGIDLVGALMNLYNERAAASRQAGGAAKDVSRADIFKRMRARTIPFKDVEEVIMDLDEPGGKFYNMQERQYDTLGGKLRNLRNNYRIMLSEMGEDSHGLLMGTVDALNEVTAHWETYIGAIFKVAIAYGVLRATTGQSISQLGAYSRAISKLDRNVRSTVFLQGVKNGGISDFLRRTQGASAMSVGRAQIMQVKGIAADENLTNLQKQRIALTAKLTETQRKHLLVLTGINKAQAGQIAGMNAFRRGLMSLRLGVISFAASAKAAFASVMASFWPLLIIQGVIEAFSLTFGRVMQQGREAEEVKKRLKEESSTNSETASRLVKGYKDRGIVSEEKDGTLSLNKEALKGVNIASEIEEARNKLQVLSPFYDADLVDIDKWQSQEKQLLAIIDKINTYRDIDDFIGQQSETLARRNRRVAGDWKIYSWLGDTFTEDLGDYAAKADRFRGIYGDSNKDIQKALKNATPALRNTLNNLKEAYNLNSDVDALRTHLQQLNSERGQTSTREEAGAKLDRDKMWKLYNETRDGGSFSFRKSLETNWRQLRADVKDFGQGLVEDINNKYQDDPDAAAAYLMRVFNSMKGQGGITNEEDKEQVLRAYISGLNDTRGKYNGQDVGDFLGDSIIKQEAGSQMTNIFGVNASSFTEENFAKFSRIIKTKAENLGIDLAKVAQKNGAKSADEWLRGVFNNRKTQIQNMKRWQKQALDMKLTIDVDTDVNYSAFVKEQREIIRNAKQTLNAHKKRLQFILGVDVVPNFDFKNAKQAQAFLDVINKAKGKLIQRRLDLQRSMAARRWELNFVGLDKDPKLLRLQKRRENVQDQIETLDDTATVTQEIVNSGGFLDKRHESWSDNENGKDEKAAEKAQKKAEEAKRKAEAAARKADNEDIKRFSDRLKALKEARKMYEDWYGKFHDKEYALAQVRDRMTRAIEKGDYVKGSLKDSDFASLAKESDLRKLLVAEENKLSAHKMRTDEGKDRKNSLLGQFEGELNALDINIADKALKEFSDAVRRSSDMLQKAYKVYEEAYKKTGDKAFSEQLAAVFAAPALPNIEENGGLSTNLRPATVLSAVPEYAAGWGRQAQQLLGLLQSALGGIGSKLFSKEQLSQLYGLDGDNLKQKVSEMLSASVSRDDVAQSIERKPGESDEAFNKRIEAEIERRKGQVLQNTDGVISLVETWAKAMEDWLSQAITQAEDLASSDKSRARKMAQFEQKYDEKKTQLNATDANGNWIYDPKGVLNDEEKALRRSELEAQLTAQKDYERYTTFDLDYSQLLKAPTSLSAKKAREVAQEASSQIMDAFTFGVIDAAEYADKTQAVNTALSKATQRKGLFGKAGGDNLLERMRGLRGLFFDARDQQNQQELAAYRSNVIQRISEELRKANSNEKDADPKLLSVLERLLQALDHIATGRGGNAEVQAAGKYGDAAAKWSSLSDDKKEAVADLAGGKMEAGAGGKNKEATNSMDDFEKALRAANGALNLFNDTLTALGHGDTGFGQILSDVTDVTDSTLQGASTGKQVTDLMQGVGVALGPWGEAAGAALGLISGIAGIHDKHLQKKIDKLQDDVSKIEGYSKTIAKAQERTLGYDTSGDLIRSYQQQYAPETVTSTRTDYLGNEQQYTYQYWANGTAQKDMYKYYSAAGGLDGEKISGYQQQYNLLTKQRQDYIDMLNAEEEKKNTDKAKKQEYEDKIAELDDQIRYFSEDLANSLWAIDLKGWADQLGDALMTAFENGEDAAEAFDDTVTSILQSLVKQMMVTSILEPALQGLRDKLFGYTDENGNEVKGAFDINDPEGSQKEVARVIGEEFGEGGNVRKAVNAAQSFGETMEEEFNKYGLTLLNNNSASMSSSIKGITEQTADLLASYLNAIRADVSVIRQLYSTKAPEYMETMSVMAKSQVQYQSQIAANTLRNAQAAENIQISTTEILDVLNAVTRDTKQFNVNVK